MKICLCIAYYPPVLGGAECQTARLASGLAARGDEVTVVTRAVPGAAETEASGRLRIVRAIRPGRRGIGFGLGYVWSLRRFFCRGPAFDIVQAVGVHLGAYVACGLQEQAGFRTVVRPTGLGPEGDVETLLRMPFWPVWHGADPATARHVLGVIRRGSAFVSLNPHMTAELRAHGFPAERIVQIANGVHVPVEAHDAVRCRSHRASLGISYDPLLLFVGRLNRHKGAQDLLDALPGLSRRFPDLGVVFLGDGPIGGELATRATQLGVGQRVLLLGIRDPAPYMQAADLFILPTHGEGMSNALLEAMAAGLPCVTTRVAGNVEVVTDGHTGVLVEPERSHELEDAITGLLSDPGLRERMGQAARRRVEESYSLEAMLDAYRDLFVRVACSTV